MEKKPCVNKVLAWIRTNVRYRINFNITYNTNSFWVVCWCNLIRTGCCTQKQMHQSFSVSLLLRKEQNKFLLRLYWNQISCILSIYLFVTVWLGSIYQTSYIHLIFPHIFLSFSILLYSLYSPLLYEHACSCPTISLYSPFSHAALWTCVFFHSPLFCISRSYK
jgi:hypothetical protein